MVQIRSLHRILENSIFLPFFPQQYLSEEKQPFKKNYRIPVDHIAKITNEGFVKTSHWPLQYWGTVCMTAPSLLFFF